MLVIRGQLDTVVPEPLQRDLFADLGTAHKVFATVECASHYLVWENQHMVTTQNPACRFPAPGSPGRTYGLGQTVA
jgi:hypothetical protein